MADMTLNNYRMRHLFFVLLGIGILLLTTLNPTSAPQPPRPFLSWGFENPNGDIVFDKTNNHHDLGLSCTDHQCTPPSYDFSNQRGTLRFDGVDDIGIAPSLRGYDYSKFTVIICGLVQASQAEPRVLIEHVEPAGGFAKGWLLRVQDHHFQAMIYKGSGISAVLETPMTVDQYHHIALIYDGETASLFVDNSLSDAADDVDFAHPSAGLTVAGSLIRGSQHLEAVIDEILIFGSAIDRAHISAESSEDPHPHCGRVQ